MIPFSKTSRSTQSEIMDDFDLQGAEMEQLLSDLAVVNAYLGGTSISLEGIKILLKDHPKSEPVTIVDVGCGDGEVLRKCAVQGRKLGYNFKLIGLDANAHILETARRRSVSFENIHFQTMNVFSEECELPNCDIALCTLFLHHFKNELIVSLLNKLIIQTRIGIVVNDLQRSKLAFRLFKAFSFVFLKTKIARHDGLVSIARSFQRNELQALSDKIPQAQSVINWKWAFRYQWLLTKKSEKKN